MRVIKPGHRNLCEQLGLVLWLAVQAVFWALVTQVWYLGRGIRCLYRWSTARE